MKKVFLITLAFSVSFNWATSQTIGDINLLLKKKYYYEKSSTLLIDGAIQNVESGSVDRSATGQIGFRQENFRGNWEVKFTVASSVEGIRSTNIKDYSRMIINPFNSKSGFDAFNLSFYGRGFKKQGIVASHTRYLYSIDSIDTDEYKKIVATFGLKKYNKFIYRLGYLLDFNVSNFQWISQNDVSKDGNIVSLNPYLIYNHRTQFLGNDVDFIFGLGPSFRQIAGDIINDKPFIKNIIGVEKTTYFGSQFTAQATINNFYAKAYYGIYGSKESVQGLTNGQLFVTIGIRAKIGNIKKIGKKVADLIDPGVPLIKNNKDNPVDIL